MSGAFGIVVDSIHGGALTGAVVRVDGTSRKAVTDDKGYYRIDSIPPGRHRLSLHHPLLDTIGMEIGTAWIDFPAGRVPVVPLGTPSGEAMVDIACPKVSNPEGSAALLGAVRDPDTGTPVVGAEVTLRWTEVRVSKEAGVRRSRRSRIAVVDSAGNYAICGLPADLGGTLYATRDGASTAFVEVAIGESAAVGLRSLSLGASEPVVDTIGGVARTLRRGPATIRGRVVDDNGAAIVGARVEVPGTPEVAFSSLTGTFALSRLPAGTQALVVRSIGFRPSETIVELSAKTPREVGVTLNSVQVLAPIEAQAAAAGLDRVGFTDRKRTTMGRFLTREDIERRIPMVVADLFTMMPGLRMTRDQSGNEVLESSRGGSRGSTSCTAVFVDRMPLYAPRPEQLIQHLNLMVRPEQVWAMEVYQADQVPGEFLRAGERCLTVVIWTRMGVGEMQDRPRTP